MGWELRRREFYYYRKHREAGRVRSEYFGKGGLAVAAALEDGCPHPHPDARKTESGGKSPAGSKAASDFLSLMLKRRVKT